MFRESENLNIPKTSNNFENGGQLLDIQNIHRDIDNALADFYNGYHQELDDQEYIKKADNFVNELQNIYVRHESFRDEYNFDRSWDQEQVDKAVSILNECSEKDGPLKGKFGVDIILRNFFSTKNTDNREEFKGKTISDLFAKSIINRLEGDANVSLNFQMAISNWVQNIHMVDRNILLDFLLAINNHPEKIDPGIRYAMTMGVGLFPSLIKTLSKLAENKKDMVSRLKVLETLKMLLGISNNAGFEQAGVEARELLDNAEHDTSNYFLSTRANQIAEEVSVPSRAKRLQLMTKYHEPGLVDKAPQPLLVENNKGVSEYFTNKILAGACYSQLSKKTGVIYNSRGEVDSYFNIENGERLSLPDILGEEGVIRNKDDDVEYAKKISIYKTLTELPLRNKIEDEFQIQLRDFNTREQLQFINFISSKSVAEVEEVRGFILSGQTAEDKNNRFASFLSLESNSDVGNKILEINKFLASKPEAADKLFAKHAELINQINQETNKVVELYGEVFFDKTIDREKLIMLSLRKTSQLLVVANENLKNYSEGEKVVVVANLIKDLGKETATKVANLEELKNIAASLNKKYKNIGDDLLESLDPGIVEDFKNFDAEYAGDEGNSRQERDFLEQESKKYKKYDSDRLKEMIDYYKYEENLERHPLSYERIRVMGEMKVEIRKEFEAIQDGLEAEHNALPSPDQAKSHYHDTIVKLQQILPLQIALEKKLDQIVYGQEDARLPKGFANFEKDRVSPENIPDQAPLYFPVGISKDLPAWEEVLKGEKKVAKPIDIYGYLFWLNNQKRPVNLIVCDEIQVNNYKLRYNKSESDAREEAIKIGAQEALQYKKIIDTFGLDNIRIRGYSEFLHQNKREYERYGDIVKNLATQPDLKDAFLSMVQDSVSGAEKEEYINYALEELAWILSTDGTKIGHLNEARYDILATVISNWEKIGQAKGLDVFADSGSPENKIILNSVCKNLRDVINEKKSKLDKTSSATAYYQRLQDHLGKIKISPKAEVDKTIKKEALSLNFVCPEVGSASFGWRGDFEGKESVVKFKEPYSTYFYKTDADLLTDSDQVVAAGEGSIGGKILTMDSKQQLKYANQVVRPILKHYFASLEKAPAQYFEQVGKNQEELKSEGAELDSLLASIRFIQKYIIKPTELV